MCENENYNGEDLCSESITLNEVYRNNDLILYESTNVYENDGCPIFVLKELFPDFEFSENKQYFLEKGDTFIHGDNIEECF